MDEKHDSPTSSAKYSNGNDNVSGKWPFSISFVSLPFVRYVINAIDLLAQTR